MNVLFTERDLTSMQHQPQVEYQVQRYSHTAIGGPKQATIKALGDDLELWKFVQMARNGVTIHADEGDPVWWGYVSQINATLRGADVLSGKRKTGYIRIGVDVEPMYNRIWVAYTQVTLGEQEVGTRATTAAANDTVSQTAYGIKELLWSRDAATAIHAEAARDMKLSQARYPQAVIQSAIGGAITSEVTMVCRGWFDTLDWRLHNNAGTATVDTAEQVYDIATERGQFFTAVDQRVTSGITINEYRDGDATAYFEIVQLLEMGTTNYRRMLARVTESRRLEITEEPTSADHWLVNSRGDVSNSFGAHVRPQTCPVGVWARVHDVIPPSVDTSLLGDASLLFIEVSEYDAINDRLILTPRGALDPWDFPKVKNG